MDATATGRWSEVEGEGGGKTRVSLAAIYHQSAGNRQRLLPMLQQQRQQQQQKSMQFLFVNDQK